MSVKHQGQGIPPSFLPTGTIIFWCGSETNIPPGWLLCDGRAVKKKIYPRLYATVAGYYNSGTEASDEFGLPSLGNRYIRGGTPGANAVTYSGSNNHSHSFTTSWGFGATADGAHAHSSNQMTLSSTTNDGGHTHTVTGQNTNSGIGDNNTSVTTTGNISTVSSANHGHVFGITSIGNTTVSHSHTTSNTASMGSGGGGTHDHTGVVGNTTITTIESISVEQSNIKVRPLIRV